MSILSLDIGKTTGWCYEDPTGQEAGIIEVDYKDLMGLIETKTTDNVSINCFQNNSEGRLIDYIQQAGEEYDGIVINPGAYAHYSYAIMDALEDLDIPVVEVHISDVHSREEFRRNLVTSRSCDKLISGKGFEGYLEAIVYLHQSDYMQ